MKTLLRLLNLECIVLLIVFIGTIAWMRPLSVDFFWHLKLGESIFNTHALMATDQFSHTAIGNPIVVTGWFFDLVLYFLFDQLGPLGVKALGALTMCLCWLFSYKSIRLFLDNKDTSAVIATAALALVTITLLPRPHLFTNVGIAALLYLMLRHMKTGKLSSLLWLIPLFAAWANLHNGFITGLLLIGVFFASAVADKIWPLSSSVSHSGDLLTFRFALIFLAAFAATAINPYGFSLYPELLSLTARATQSGVREWQSMDFRSLPGAIALALMIVYMVMLALTNRLRSWVMLLVPLATMAAMLTSTRNAPFWSLTFAPFFAILLGEILSKRNDDTSSSQIQNSLTKSVSPAVARTVNSVLLFTVLAIAIVTSPIVSKYHHQKSRQNLAIGATDFLLGNVPDARLFNQYGSGGYIIWKANGRFPVFIDGRYAPYSNEIIGDYLEAIDGTENALSHLAKYDVEVAVIQREGPLVSLLELSSKYRRVYLDDHFTVFVLSIPKFSDVESLS